jgi:hypothetical protein
MHFKKASSIKPSTQIQKSDHEGNFIISCGNDEDSDEGIAEYITLQAKPGLLNITFRKTEKHITIAATLARLHVQTSSFSCCSTTSHLDSFRV